MLKKFILALFVTAFFTPTFAQTARVSNGLDKYLQQQLAQVTKKIETQMNLQLKTFAATLSTATQPTVSSNEQEDTKQATTQAEERCGESGHTRSQAKNHKGPCVWLPVPTSSVEKTANPSMIFDERTNTYIWIDNAGRTYRYLINKKSSASQQSQPKDSTKRKYPPYW